jgi:putative transposase
MFKVLLLLLQALVSSCRNRADLLLEILALRQQLAAFALSGERPRVTVTDRWFWIVLRRRWARWADVLIFVKPETVIRWHRAGFRRYWTWLSRRHRRPGRPPTDRSIRDLIQRMATENPTWGAPRIHGELRLLGIAVSERTVSRSMPRRPPHPDAVQRWRIFLQNHHAAIAAMDFFVVPTATFRLVYVWFVIGHDRRRILHVDVTASPAAAWVIQQLREAFPFGTAPRHMIFDRDAIFSSRVVSTMRSFGIQPARTAWKSPWQNGVAERWIGSVRRELLDHVVILNERHLRRLLTEYVAYYHDDRTHLGLDKATPASRSAAQCPAGDAAVVALPRVGGLHHRYEWRAAA